MVCVILGFYKLRKLYYFCGNVSQRMVCLEVVWEMFVYLCDSLIRSVYDIMHRRERNSNLLE